MITFEVILAVASDLIANVVKEALAVAARLATRVLTELVELLRSASRMIGQTVGWLESASLRITGDLAELFAAGKAMLGRFGKLLDELASEGALADTGAGGMHMPIPDSPAPANVLESRAIKPTELAAPPRAKGTPSRYKDPEIRKHLDEVRGPDVPGRDDVLRPVELGKTALDETGMQVRTLQKVDQYHHLFVQQLKKWFKSKGINIDEYTVLLSADEHRWIHNEYRWNDLWKDYKRLNPQASADEIIAHLEDLKKQVGLEGLDIVPYPRP